MGEEEIGPKDKVIQLRAASRGVVEMRASS
jgi:hypothetical protein